MKAKPILLTVMTALVLAAPHGQEPKCEPPPRPKFLEYLKPEDVGSIVFYSEQQINSPDGKEQQDPPTMRFRYRVEKRVAFTKTHHGLVSELRETGRRGDGNESWSGYLPPHFLLDKNGNVVATVIVYADRSIVDVDNGAGLKKSGNEWEATIVDSWPPVNAEGYESAHGFNKQYARLVYELLWQVWSEKMKDVEAVYQRVKHPLPELLFGKAAVSRDKNEEEAEAEQEADSEALKELDHLW